MKSRIPVLMALSAALLLLALASPPVWAADPPPQPEVDPLTGQRGRIGAAVNAAVAHEGGHVLVQLLDTDKAHTLFVHGYELLFDNWYKVTNAPGESASSAIARLGKQEVVQTVELDYIFTLGPGAWQTLDATAIEPAFRPNDPFYRYQWHFPAVQAEQAWDRSAGQGVKVAVIDTGIAKGTDLACHTFVDEYNAITNRSGAGVARDDQGHGTHVAGTIAQCTNNGLGVAGLAYRASLMPIKALDNNGAGASSVIARGIDWARTRGAAVINLSLGMNCGSQGWPACSSSVINTALNRAADAGILIVAASGNASQAVVSFPANHPQTIAVGAVDLRLNRAPYSSYGVDLNLVAPGGDVSRDLNSDGYGDGVLQQTFTSQGWGYYFFDGTSMATPHAAAAAAILKSARPQATRQQIQQALQSTARDLGAAGFDTRYGYGLIQLDAALTALMGQDTTPPSGDFTAPAAEAEVTAPVWLRASVQDNPGGSGIANVVFTTNATGAWTVLAEDTTPPYEYQWNMTGVPDGHRFMIGLEIHDRAGNRAGRVRWITKKGGGVLSGDFTAPAAEARVSPPVRLRVEGANIARVRFTSNGTGQWRFIAEDRTAPFEVSWDMAGVPDGHRFMVGAELYDAAGNRINRVRWITKTSDATPPTGHWVEPAAEATVTAPVKLKVEAQDASGIARVNFTSNGSGQWRFIAAVTSPPYEILWDMAGVAQGQRFMVGAEIYDRAGNRANIVRWMRRGSPAALANGDFEQGAGAGWREYSTHGWDIILHQDDLPVTPRSGQWAAWLGGDDDEISAILQRVAVPPDRPLLTFWYWIASADRCGYDFAGVVIDANTQVDAFTLCQSRNTGGWQVRSVDLSAYAGSSIDLQMRVQTDGFLNSNLFLDDVAFAATVAASDDSFTPEPLDAEAGSAAGKDQFAPRPTPRFDLEPLSPLWAPSTEPK